jgi:hypothetical protein
MVGHLLAFRHLAQDRRLDSHLSWPGEQVEAQPEAVEGWAARFHRSAGGDAADRRRDWRRAGPPPYMVGRPIEDAAGRAELDDLAQILSPPPDR